MPRFHHPHQGHSRQANLFFRLLDQRRLGQGLVTQATLLACLGASAALTLLTIAVVTVTARLAEVY